MGENTNIEWADHTFNPWVGCEKVSPGCAHCYAETLVTGRMARAGTWGADGTRQRTSESTWKHPARWERDADRFQAEHGRRQRVFCASLADVFEPRPELEPWRSDLFRLIESTSSLDWLLLTKRPELARDWLHRWYVERRPLRMRDDAGTLWVHAPSEGREWVGRDDIGWGMLPNVWIGTSIENSRHTWRADVLRGIPAAVRFISAEPLLGSLFDSGRPEIAVTSPRAPLDLTGIDWVIVGGESGGRNARPMHPAWAREIRDAVFQQAYGVPLVDPENLPPGLTLMGEPLDIPAGLLPSRPVFFFKQWGSWAPRGYVSGLSDIDKRAMRIIPGDPHADPEEGGVSWHVYYYGAGPKSAGKVFDNREWCEFPRGSEVLTPA